MKKPKKIVRFAVTAILVVAAVSAAFYLYRRYVEAPWTRDGQVSANIVLIAPRISGQVVEVSVRDNQSVRKGDVLFRIDARQYELQLESARVALQTAHQQVSALEASVGVARVGVVSAEKGAETARGKVEASQAQMDAAESQVDAAAAGLKVAEAGIAQANASLRQRIRQRDRAAKLAKNGAGSVSSAQSTEAAAESAAAALDSAKANLLSAQAKIAQAAAGLDQAKANLIVARTGVGSAEAQVESARANLLKARADLGTAGEENVGVMSARVNLRNAELNLEWTSVRAPSDGYVTNLGIATGEFASAGHTILAFVDSSSFHVLGFFKETQLRHLEIGQRALVTLMSHGDQPIEGEVESIGWAISPPNLAQTGRDGDGALVPVIQPSFDWIRLAQRVPVRIKLTGIPEGIQLISGTTTSVSIQRGN